jgi:hypothetical protein
MLAAQLYVNTTQQATQQTLMQSLLWPLHNPNNDGNGQGTPHHTNKIAWAYAIADMWANHPPTPSNTPP